MENKNIGTAKLKTYIQITRITIVICWIALFAFWAIKLFGGNFFEIVVQNDNFIKFSDIVQNTWVKYLVSFFTIFLSNYLFIGAITQKYKFKNEYLLIYIFSAISMWLIVNFININFLKLFYGYIVFILIGIFTQKGIKRLNGFLASICELSFTVISTFVRCIEINLITNYMFILIMLIDFYIMAFLYFLYANLIRLKKEI